MKANQMSEPISTGVGAAAGWKILGGLAGMGAIGAGLAAFVVMALTKPKTDQEWRVALICTLVSSIGGGSALVRWLGFQHWVEDPFGMIAMLAFAFACGLPGWALIRALFIFLDKRRDADLAEIVKDVKEMV
jgi:hypothetical protein